MDRVSGDGARCRLRLRLLRRRLRTGEREAPSLGENYAQCRVSAGAEDDNAEDEEMTSRTSAISNNNPLLVMLGI